MDRSPSYSPRAKTLFVLYIILCVSLFAYLRFPYYLLKPKMEAALSAAIRKEVALGDITARLPWGFTVKDVRIEGETLAPRLTLRPSLLSLIIGRMGFSFAIDQDTGRLSGRIKTSLRHPGDPLDITLKLKEFDVAPLKKLLKGGSEIDGTVNGTFALNTSRERFKESQGALKLVWRDGQIPLNIPSFPLAAIPFATFEVEARMDKGALTIRKANLSGNDVSGSLTGSVKLGQNASSSQLKIGGDLRLSPGYRALMGGAAGDRLRIRLNGTLGRPQISLQ